MDNALLNPSIILIDDEPGVLSALKLLLKTIGFEVIEFIDPLLALQYLTTNRLKNIVIVSDLRMPKIDGIELLRLIREKNINYPYILMSAHATSQDIEDAKSKGANEFLSKPFTPDQFRQTLKKVINNKLGD